MYTLLQLIAPAFLFWLIWKAFHSPQRGDGGSSGSSDTASSRTSGDGSQGKCNDRGSDSCNSGDGGVGRD